MCVAAGVAETPRDAVSERRCKNAMQKSFGVDAGLADALLEVALRRIADAVVEARGWAA